VILEFIELRCSRARTVVYFDVRGAASWTTVSHDSQKPCWLKRCGIQQKVVSRDTHPVSHKDCAVASGSTLQVEGCQGAMLPENTAFSASLANRYGKSYFKH